MARSTNAHYDSPASDVDEPTSRLHRENTDTIAEAAAVAADEALDESGYVSHIDVTDEASVLKDLTEGVRDQEDLQRDISHQANLVFVEKEDERDLKRIEKAKSTKAKLVMRRRTHQSRLSGTSNLLQRQHIQSEVGKMDEEIAALERDISDIQARIDSRHRQDAQNPAKDLASGSRRMPNESQRDFLIRTGKITPFSQMPVREDDGLSGELKEVLMDAEEDMEAANDVQDTHKEPESHQHLRLPGFEDPSAMGYKSHAESEFSLRPRKKRRLSDDAALSSKLNPDHSESTESSSSQHPVRYKADFGDYSSPKVTDSEAEADPIDYENEENSILGTDPVDTVEDLRGLDDGNEANYQARLKSWIARRSRARLLKQSVHESNQEDGDQDNGEIGIDLNEDEWFKPSPDGPDHHFENGLRLPGDIYHSLFDYQKTGVRWLGELYDQQVGGIIGDEMGLGKTIQIISFLAGLHYSKKLTKPVIVIAPGTVLRQWVNEFHRWWPPLRVSILHTSGSGMLNTRNERRLEDDDHRTSKSKKAPKFQKAAKKIVDRVVLNGHVLVTTYAGLQTYGELLIPIHWGYAVLDEGHKIRNPNTSITVYCKELQTANRVILSGTPMQNNLIELWSLFDFVYPMRLGTLVNFRNQFEIPIKLGGYANATNLQILTATKCAETLKEAISPYLLQRVKADVAADLPKKSEQVLFCKLTKPQREAYELFLNSDDMTSILNRTRQSLYGIDILRKICNHPDLLDPSLRKRHGYKWGNPHKSGKMQVVKALLEIWKKAGDKILLFSQGVQMLNIIESFVRELNGFRYLRMDGSTNMKERQSMVDQFNNDPDIDVFLLTTKVGGLGVNLTGANRVIIFDPDWNPSTDVQARERAWRLGQKKEVTIYRLMTAGTIEEKIYHRQIFKQFLADKILKDPKQRQTFHMKDLYDLFTLGNSDDTTETGQMFAGTEQKIMTQADSSELTSPGHAGTSFDAAKAVSVHLETPEIHDQNVPGVDPNNEEVRRITGVSKLEEFRGDPNEDKSTEDSRIMEGLFARSGVHSVLQHDQIVNGKRVVSADRGMLEREAKKIAAEAAADLRRAGEAARNIPIGTVTWTGEVGEAGRPTNNRRGGPSSTSILSSLSSRQGLSIPISADNSRSGAQGSSSHAEPRGKDFLKLIRDYIILHGGSVPTQMLVVHFSSMCKTSQQSAEFKAMLEEVADLKRGSGRSMRGKWVLKPEFTTR